MNASIHPRLVAAWTRRAPLLACAGWLASVASAEAPWTLERAVQHALANNPDARVAALRVAAAEAGVQQANAAVWPRLQFQSSATRTDNPMHVFGSLLNQRAFGTPPLGPIDFNRVPDVDNQNVQGQLTVPLYAGGQIEAGRTAARALGAVAREDAEAVRQRLAFEVVRTFHTLGKTRAFVRAAEAAVRGFEQNLGIARQRERAGTLLRADVLDVEVRLAQAREDLVRARNARELALRVLRNLLGLEPGPFEVAETAPAVAAPETGDYSGRPELAALRHAVAAADAGVRRARGGHYPGVSAFGSLDFDHGWRSGGDGRSYTAGVLLHWNLWDGRLTRAKVREAEARAAEAREQERQLRLGLDLEVEQARLSLQEAAERLEVSEKAIALASESVELTRARFEQGLALATQLIDAETTLTAARVRRAEAEADRRIAVAALRHALGLPPLDAP